VVRLFGRRPDPWRFGLARLGSFAAFVILAGLLGALAGPDDAAPSRLLLYVGLWLPVGVGLPGWGVSVRNRRVRWRE